MITNYGMNSSVNLFGPFPDYDASSYSDDSVLHYYLKANHFIILTFALTPLENATSGESVLAI